MSNPAATLLSNSQSQQSLDRRMHGSALHLARGIYIVLLITILGLAILGIPGYFMDVEGQHRTLKVTVSLLITVEIITISLFIFLRRSDDWLVFLIALAMVFVGGFEPTVAYGSRSIGLAPLYRLFDSTGSTLLQFLYFLFPNGVFAPAWTRKFSRFIFGWGVVSFFLYSFGGAIPWWTQNPNGLDLTLWIWYLLSVVGVYSQIYRFRHVSNPIERQQVKWFVISLPFATFAAILELIFRSFHFANMSLSDLLIISDSLKVVSYVFVAVSIGFAVYRYKLWDTDFYINRTLIYGIVTALLAGLWWFGAILVQLFINNVIKQESSTIMVALLSGIPAASLFQPLRENAKKWVNTRIYKDQLDFTKAIVELLPENWQFVSHHDMAQAVMKNTARLLEIDKAAIYTFDNESLQLMNSYGMRPDQANQFREMNISELQKGKVIRLGKENPFTMLIPLVVPRGLTKDLIGVLALGPRAQDRGYSRDHLSNLKNLGERAGMAIHFLQLNEKKKLLDRKPKTK